MPTAPASQQNKARSTALDKIAALAETHNLSIEEIAARLAAKQITPQRQSNMLKQLLGYIGGAFVFAGLALFIAIIWDDVASLQRVILTLGVGLVSFVLGFMSMKDERYDRATTPFFIISALMQTVGLFVFLHEYIPDGGNAQLAALSVFSVMALQQAVVFQATQRTSLAFTSIFFWIAALSTGFDLLHLSGKGIAFLCGLSLLCISWTLDRTPHRSLSPFTYFFGSCFLLGAAWDYLDGNVLYLALNAFMVYLSIRVSSRTLLTVSVISLLSYLCDFTYEHFKDSKAWPLALIVMGLVMIGLSSYAIKLGQRISGRRA